MQDPQSCQPSYQVVIQKTMFYQETKVSKNEYFMHK